MVQAFLHGLILALGLILPLGVQNLFVFQQGAAHSSFVHVLPVIFTAALCDTALILLAVQGVSLFLLKFPLFKLILLSIGVVFLTYMGWVTWNDNHVPNEEAPAQKTSPRQQVIFAASVSLLNPHAVMDTIGVIGTSSSSYEGLEKSLFAFACIFVSWVWFFFLAAAGRMIGRQAKFSTWRKKINQVSAVFMWLSAAAMAYSAM